MSSTDRRLWLGSLIGVLLFVLGAALIALYRPVWLGVKAKANSARAARFVSGYDTGGKVPGNPENGIQDLKLIYRCGKIYKKEHGVLPRSCMDLVEDMARRPQAYPGSYTDLFNSDSVYSDVASERQRPEGHIPYQLLTLRPDGTPVGGPKAAGTRDVLAFTDLYYHRNVKYLGGDRTSFNPVGFSLVLWDDGTVEKVPFAKKLFIPARDSFIYGFPGQAGLPEKTWKFWEFYWNHRGDNSPRGKG